MKGFSRRVNARSPPATIVSFDYTNKEESIRVDIWYDKNGTTKGKNRYVERRRLACCEVEHERFRTMISPIVT